MKSRQTLPVRQAGISIFLLFILLFTTQKLSAQFWAQSLGGTEVDEVMDIARDPAGNIYSAGYFTNQVVFGTTLNLSSASFGIPDIFIQKSNSSGVVQWAVKAGGLGSDRALSIATDATGNIYITGFYFGTATFGSFTLNSVSGSKDCFIAKLDNFGNFLWVTSCGGNLADIGNAIDVDPNGNIFVGGQFEGTATFGATTFTSLINPNTSLPSIDVFISKLDASGNFLWSKHGAAEFTDRALDLVCDNSGNAYVCGQFSDTIQFANVYNNQVMNSIFLMKVDAAGNETWFRKASGSYSIPYALVLDNNQDVYMTGDYQGQLAFFGSPMNYISDNYLNRVFLAKYSPSGNFIWASSSSSSNDLTSRGVDVDPNNDPYIIGEFSCTLNDYADLYGQGTFNTVGYHDIFVTKFNGAGTYQWARNFGSPGMDKAHGIVVKTVDRPVTAGSFEKRVTWPVNGISVTSSLPSTMYSVASPVQNGAYCSDPSYGNYDGIRAMGYSDGFIAEAIDISREPYDYYQRTGSSCVRPFVSGCIDDGWSYTCPDTLEACQYKTIYANSWTGSGIQGSYGPEYNILWSTGPFDTLYQKTVNVTGDYSVNMTTRDGCYSLTDTIHVIIHPLPAGPTISDDELVNVQQGPMAMQIRVCAPDSVWLWAGNFSPADTFGWHSGTGPGGPLLAMNDSLLVTTSGWYNFTVTNQFGCSNYNRVEVIFDNPLPTWNVLSLIPDTIVVCQGRPVILLFYESISNPSGNPSYQLYNFWQQWSSSPSLVITPFGQQIGGSFIAQNSGTYIVTDSIFRMNACGADTIVVSDTFYLDVLSNPSGSISITSPQYLCPGDTAYLIATVNASANSTYTITPNDTIMAVTQGNFLWTVVLTDTITGCTTTIYQSRNLPYKPNPVLTTVPASGLICPNDSALIHCSNGTALSYQWIGPNGILPWTTQDIWDSVPGFYHCIIVDQDGCQLTSNTVELKQYNTPYMIASPGNVVCLNQTVTLQVITNDTTNIVWNAPLSGGGTQQVVTQTGTYSCSVTMCGITTVCTMQVIVSTVQAATSGTTTLCPGDSTWIFAVPAAATFTWTPGNITADSIFVAAGSYTMTATDANGCTTTTVHAILTDSSTVAPQVTSDTVCIGMTATISASANGPIEWYDQVSGGTLLDTGSVFTFANVQNDTIFYVWTQDTSGCHSVMQPVYILVDPASYPPVVTSGDTVCTGDTLFLSVNNVAGATYTWTGPGGYSSSQQNPIITPVASNNAGTYSVVITGLNCVSPTSVVNVIVVNPVAPLVSWNDTICEGTFANPYIINADSNLIYQWTGPQGFTATGDTISIGPATLNMAGIYTVGTSGACSSGPSNYNLTVLAGPGPFTASVNSPVCPGDTIYFQASSGPGIASYEWFGVSNGYYSNQQNPFAIADSSMSGTYNVFAHSANGCASLQPQSVTVFVHPEPIVSIGPDTMVCASPPYFIIASGNYPSYTWHDNYMSQQHPALQTGLYWVMVIDSNGCRGYDSAYIEVIRCEPERQNIFTPNNDGHNDVFNLGGQNYRSSQCIIYDRWGALIYEWNDPLGSWNGTYKKTNDPVEEGVYYYVAQVESYDGVMSEITGFIQLMR